MNNSSLTISYSGITRRILSDVVVSNPNDGTQVKIKALWDTGATNCVISEKYAKAANLAVVGSTTMNHAGGESQVNEYVANLTLPNNVTVAKVKVLGNDAIKGFDFIVGMDVITLGDFCLTNKDGKTVVSFRIPSLSVIDFVKETNEAKARLYKRLGRNAMCPCGSKKKVKDCCGKDFV